MHVESRWTKPPKQSGGRDHLGVQAPAMSIYGRLLPGITNVTDRARYYSFYPWLIWALEQDGHKQYNDDFVDSFRKADCLFTLIASSHEREVNHDHAAHTAATVGSSSLYQPAVDLEAGGTLELSAYALLGESPSRYFKNKLGGLGQYYLGVLSELGILNGDSRNGVQYTKPYGVEIARAMDEGVDRERFLSVVRANQVNDDDLKALSDFCPCSLAGNRSEREILRQLFFVRDQYFSEEALPRRRTLQVVAYLHDLCTRNGLELTQEAFRGLVYAGALPDQTALGLPGYLAHTVQRWRFYAEQELLSLATQGLFYAILDAYEESGLRLSSVSRIVDWYLAQPEVRDAIDALDGATTFTGILGVVRSSLPSVSDWRNKNHEHSLAESILSLSKERKQVRNRSEIVATCIRVICALIVRSESRDETPFQGLAFPNDYLSHQYPINLVSLSEHVSDTWQTLDVTDWLGWLFNQWGISTHLRVALRKLRAQNQSTFQLRPDEYSYTVIGVPEPTHTTPRFAQATRILKDVVALLPDDDGHWRMSEFGESMLAVDDAG